MPIMKYVKEARLIAEKARLVELYIALAYAKARSQEEKVIDIETEIYMLEDSIDSLESELRQ